jgi:hypothetical protein
LSRLGRRPPSGRARDVASGICQDGYKVVADHRRPRQPDRLASWIKDEERWPIYQLALLDWGLEPGTRTARSWAALDERGYVTNPQKKIARSRVPFSNSQPAYGQTLNNPLYAGLRIPTRADGRFGPRPTGPAVLTPEELLPVCASCGPGASHRHRARRGRPPEKLPAGRASPPAADCGGPMDVGDRPASPASDGTMREALTVLPHATAMRPAAGTCDVLPIRRPSLVDAAFVDNLGTFLGDVEAMRAQSRRSAVSAERGQADGRGRAAPKVEAGRAHRDRVIAKAYR